MGALRASDTRRRGQARGGPCGPRRFEADDPVVTVAGRRRQRQAFAPAVTRCAALAMLPRSDPLAPAVHRLAQGFCDLDPVADVCGVQQTGLDQGMEVVVVEPDGHKLLSLLQRDDTAAKGLGEGQRNVAAAGRAPVDGELRLLAADQGDVQPADLAP
jgi:hypothetical protein